MREFQSRVGAPFAQARPFQGTKRRRLPVHGIGVGTVMPTRALIVKLLVRFTRVRQSFGKLMHLSERWARALLSFVRFHARANAPGGIFVMHIHIWVLMSKLFPLWALLEINNRVLHGRSQNAHVALQMPPLACDERALHFVLGFG